MHGAARRWRGSGVAVPLKKRTSRRVLAPASPVILLEPFAAEEKLTAAEKELKAARKRRKAAKYQSAFFLLHKFTAEMQGRAVKITPERKRQISSLEDK